jgi:hypothetical protein
VEAKNAVDPPGEAFKIGDIFGKGESVMEVAERE